MDIQHLLFNLAYKQTWYLDPGTGSYILQIVLALLFGLGFAIKVFWKRIIAFISNLFKRNAK